MARITASLSQQRSTQVKTLIYFTVCTLFIGSVQAQTPSLDEMWDLLQTQQMQIETLQAQLQNNQSSLSEAKTDLQVAESALELSQNNAAQIAETITMLEITADAIEAGSMINRSRTQVGGYGEMHYNNLDTGNQLDFHRFVMFFSHQFRDDLSFYSELEVEHIIAGDGQPGEVEVEQAFIQWEYAPQQRLNMGVFLIPVGILNETHEPDTFFGVERNPIEKNVIPSTWWEGGLALNGEISPGWHYDFGLHGGLLLDTANESASKRSNIRSARQKVAKSNVDSLAYTGRISYSGIPGFRWSATLQYQSDLTQGDADGIGIDTIDATLFETNVILQRGKFGLRALYARWDIDDEIERLNPGSDEQFGWYIEPSITFGSGLGLFARYGLYDLTAGKSATSNERKQLELGFNYWLHDNVVFKANYQRQDNDKGEDVDGFNLGFGYSF